MVELDPIEQEIIVETEKAIANLEALIKQNQRLAAQSAIDVAALENLQRQINGLEGKRIFVDVEMTDRAAGSMTDFVSHLNDATSAGERVIAVNKDMTASIIEMTAAEEGYAAAVEKSSTGTGNRWARVLDYQDEALGRMNASLQDFVAHLDDATSAQERFFTVGEEGIAVERSLDQTIRDASNSIFAEAEATRKLSAARNELNDAARQVGLSDKEMGRLARASGDALFQQGNEAANKADKLYKLIEAHNVWTDAEAGTLWVPKEMAQMMGFSAQETEKAATAAAHAGRTFAIWGTGVRLTGYGLHWLIAGSTELLAVLIPALIAAGAAAGVMAEGVTWANDRLKAVYTSTEATSAMLHTTSGQVLGLKSSLQQAQTTADPMVWELYGSAISAARESFGGFWSKGLDVVHMLDTFAAHVDLSLGPGGVLGSQTQSAIKSMVTDLQGLGQVLGNVGHFFLTLATDMPGVAEMLLSAIAGVTGLINRLSQLKYIGLGLTSFMIIEEIGRWGGLAMLGLGPLITGMGTLVGKAAIAATELPVVGGALAGVAEAGIAAGAGLETVGVGLKDAGAMTKTLKGALMMPFTTLPGLVLLSAAAIYILGERYHMLGVNASQAGSMMQQMAQIQQQIGSDTPAQAIGDIAAKLKSLNTAVATTNLSSNFFANAWNTIKSNLLGGTPIVVGATMALSAHQNEVNKLVMTQAELLGMNTHINGSYYSLSGAIGLASAAGVHMNQMFNSQGNLSAIALQMIKNLINGYQMMAQTGTILANDMNAVDVQTLMQQTRVQQLNQAWDSFLSTVTGGTGALGSLNSDLTTIGNVALTATSKIQAFGQQAGGTSLSVKQISYALQSFSGTSAQVWTNYNAALTQAGQVTDWLRTAAAAGGVTAEQYKQSIKGVVSELLPYAAHSRTAVAELSALAQQAGGPATDSYQLLSTWLGNTKVAQDALNGTVKTATQYMSNLGQVAANLSTTLNSEVASALAQGAVNVKAIADAAQRFNTQLHTGNVNTWAFSGSVAGLVRQLLGAGQPLKDVVSVMDQMAKRAGMNTGQIQQLNTQILDMAAALGKIHDVTATVRLNEITTQITQVPGSGATGPIPSGKSYKPTFARGGMVPGSGSGDTVPAMLTPGEAIVPKHLVPRVAPFLGAHGVPGFARGGIAGGAASQHGLTPMEIVIRQWAKNIWHDEYRKYGEKGPIPLDIMEQIFGPRKFGKTGMWKNPQYVKLVRDEQADMGGYFSQDVSYWHHAADIKNISASENKQIAIWEKDIRTHYGAATEAKRMAQFRTELARYEEKLAKEKDPYWRKIYRQDISRVEAELKAEPTYYKNKFLADIANLKKIDASKIFKDREAMLMLMQEMGYALRYSKGGAVPFGTYDQGGYLPTGLSLAMNGTGRPEPVGHGGGGVTHVHIEVGGREIANAIVPDMVGSVNRYSYRNTGRATGILRP